MRCDIVTSDGGTGWNKPFCAGSPDGAWSPPHCRLAGPSRLHRGGPRPRYRRAVSRPTGWRFIWRWRAGRTWRWLNFDLPRGGRTRAYGMTVGDVGGKLPTRNETRLHRRPCGCYRRQTGIVRWRRGSRRWRGAGRFRRRTRFGLVGSADAHLVARHPAGRRRRFTAVPLLAALAIDAALITLGAMASPDGVTFAARSGFMQYWADDTMLGRVRGLSMFGAPYSGQPARSTTGRRVGGSAAFVSTTIGPILKFIWLRKSIPWPTSLKRRTKN